MAQSVALRAVDDARQETTTGLKCWKVSGLPATWQLGKPVPQEADRATLSAWLARTSSSDRPATVQEFAVALEPLFRFAKAFGIPCEPSECTAAYRAVMDSFPPGVISGAIEAARQGWTNTYRLPLPAELKGFVPADYWRVRSEMQRVRSALREMDEGNVETGEEAADKAEIKRVLDGLKIGAAA